MKINYLESKVFKSQILTSLQAVFAAAILVLSSNIATADSFVISCTDADDASTCSVDTTDSGVKTPLVELVEELLDVATANPDEFCEETNGVYTCNTESQLEFTCTKDNDNQASCNFGGTPTDPIISLDCNRDALSDSGSCALETDEEQVDEIFEDVGEEERIARSNNQQVLQSINTVCNDNSAESALNEDCNALISLIDGGSAEDIEEAAEIVRQVTPMNAGTSVSAVVSSVGALNNNVSSRLTNLRNNDGNSNSNVDVSGLQFFDGKQLFSAEDLFETNQFTAAAAAGSEDQASSSIADYGRLGFFINGTLLFGEEDSTDQEGGSEFDTSGLSIGIDYRYTDNLVGGLAFGFSNTTTEFTGNDGELTALGYTLTAYGSYYFKQFYVDVTFGLGGSDFEQERSITYTGVSQIMTSDFFGNQSSLSIGGGADFSFMGWNINPFTQISTTTVNIEDYEEKASDPDAPGAGWALIIEDQELTSLLFNLGAQATYVFNQNWGVVIPLARFELVNELDDDDRFVVGRFAGGGTVKDASGGIDGTFSLQTNEVDTSYYNLGFGVSMLMTNGNSAFFYYQATLGFDDLSQNMVNAGWRWEF